MDKRAYLKIYTSSAYAYSSISLTDFKLFDILTDFTINLNAKTEKKLLLQYKNITKIR